MQRTFYIPFYGDMHAVKSMKFSRHRHATNMMVNGSFDDGYFAVRIADDGLKSFGLLENSYAILRASSIPPRDCCICLVDLDGNVSLKLIEQLPIGSTVLRVSGDKISPVELQPGEFSILGFLDGIVPHENAEFCLSGQLELELA